MNLVNTCRSATPNASQKPAGSRRSDQRETATTTPLAETIIGIYKTELIHRRGPWKGIDDVEYATLEYVDWFNHRRLLEPIGYVPPAEHEQAYRREHDPSYADGPTEPSLR